MLKNFILNSSFNHELWLNYLRYEDFKALFNSDADIKSLFKRFWPQKRILQKCHKIRFNEQYQCFGCHTCFNLKLYKFYDLVFLLCKKQGCREIALQHTKPQFNCPFMIPKSNLWFVMGEHPIINIARCPVKEFKVFIGNYCGMCFKQEENTCQRMYGSIFTATESIVIPVCKMCKLTMDLTRYVKNKPFVFIYNINLTKCEFFIKSGTLSYVEDADMLVRDPIRISLNAVCHTKTFSHSFHLAYTSNFYFHVDKLQHHLYSGIKLPPTIDFQSFKQPFKPENNFFKKHETFLHEPIEHWNYLQPTLAIRDVNQLEQLWNFNLYRQIEVVKDVEDHYDFVTWERRPWTSDIIQLLTFYYLRWNLNLTPCTRAQRSKKKISYQAVCWHPSGVIEMTFDYQYYYQYNYTNPFKPYVSLPFSYQEANLFASEDEFALRTSDSDNDGYITQ